MSDSIHRPEHTALLFVDPYNDFLSEGGKLWPDVAPIAKEVRLLDNLRTVVAEVRRAGIRVFIVPHRRWEPGDFTSWDHATPYQLASARAKVFAKGTWGGEWHPDFVPKPGDVPRSISEPADSRIRISTCSSNNIGSST